MLVWVVLLCLCAALPNGRAGADEYMLWSDSLTSVGYRARHGMVACTPRATWSRYPFGHRARYGLPLLLLSHLVAPLGASHGALTHDCLVHARGLVGPAPLRIVDAPNLPTALTVLTRPLCLPWEILRELIPPKKGPCDLSWGGIRGGGASSVVPPAHLVGHAFQGCCPPQLPHTCWRPFGHGVAHARRLKSAHTWSAKRGRTWGGVICCCW